MKWKGIVCGSIICGMLTGCASVKPLSRRERADIKTLCVVSDLNDYFTYCKYKRGPEIIPSKRVSDSVLNLIKSDLKKKGYALTDNPDVADYRLVIRPATIHFFEDRSAFDGFAISAFYSEVKVYAAIVMGLVDPETGACRISKRVYWKDPTTVEYAPDLWKQFSEKEKEKLFSAMERAAVPTVRTCLKQIGL